MREPVEKAKADEKPLVNNVRTHNLKDIVFVYRLATGKAPGPDRVPNEILKGTTDLLLLHIELTTTTSLYFGHCEDLTRI